MKIVCDKCAAKYSIADEKVSGKVFKLRCKKCGHIIVVKGGSEGEAAQTAAQSSGSPSQDAAASSADSAAPDAVWHLVIDREQVGPMNAQDVRAKHQGGQIDGETYAWKEGFGDWVKLATIDEFHDLFGEARAPSDDQATRRQDPQDLFRQPVSSEPPGADLFGNGQGMSQGIQTSAPTSPTIMGGAGSAAQFASAFESARPSQGTPAPSSSTPGFGSGDMGGSPGGVEVKSMTGARSENSVLFSLNNLQALAMSGPASSSPAPTQSSSSSASAAPRPGYASSQGEASGLIDIRAMAAQTLSANAFSAGLAGSKSDDLPMMSDAPMFSPVAQAVLLPTSEPAGMPKWVWVLLGVGGLGIVSVLVVLIVVLTSSPPPAPQVKTQPAGGPVAQTEPGATAPKQPVAQPPGEGPGQTARPAPTGPKDKGAGETVAAGGDTKKERRSKDKDKDKPSRKEKEAAAAAPAPAQVEQPEKKPQKPAKPKDDLDSLLESATGSGGSKPKGGGAAKDAPEQLSMDTIKSGLKGVSGAVQACGTPGTYMVKLTIGRNGRVTDANVTNKSGDPSADCVSKAVKTARFPEFTGAPQGMTYPFIVR